MVKVHPDGKLQSMMAGGLNLNWMWGGDEGALKEVPFKLRPGGWVGVFLGGYGGSEEELFQAEQQMRVT